LTVPTVPFGLLLAGLLPAPGAPQNDLEATMQALTGHVRAVTEDLRAGDLPAVAERARAAREVASRLPLPAGGVARAEDYRGQAAALAELLGEVQTLAAGGRALGAQQAFSAARAACVSCHVRFRDGLAERGSFPARDNVVHGRVALADSAGAALEDRSWVLVFLEGSGRPPREAYERLPPRMSQQGRRFDPRVLPIPVGATVDFPNDDEIFHNVFSLSKAHPFDLGIYEPGRSRPLTFEESGLVKVYCNIHPEMAASIVVLEWPHFTLTDASGAFVLSDVPDGVWVLRAWNDRGAEARLELEVGGGEVLEVPLELRETHRVLPHRNKFGKRYKQKY